MKKTFTFITAASLSSVCLMLTTQAVIGQKISGGQSHSVAVCIDGSVKSWGDNTWLQLGKSSFTSGSTTPLQVNVLSSGVKWIASGNGHNLAIKNDNTVWGWGYNEFGETGNGGVANVSNPAMVPGLAGVIAVSGGADHSLALKNDGTVWAWGRNNHGQIGKGSITTSELSPLKVGSFNDIKAIEAAGDHSFIVKNDGTVWAFGGNSSGQLGDGSTTDRTSPVQISGLVDITAIASGYGHSIALKSDGTVFSWGKNTNGQLGDGTTTDRLTATQVTGLTGITYIVCGGNHTLALKNDGTVWAWGAGGALGDNASVDRTSPVQVSNITGVIAIGSGIFHSLALKADKTVWSWGDNNYGQLGIGNSNTKLVPTELTTLCEVSADTVPVVTAISEVSNTDFKLYPNPSVNGTFRVSFNNGIKKSIQFSVFDMMGRKIYANILEDEYSELDLSRLNKGIYFIKPEGSTIQKLIIQ